MYQELLLHEFYCMSYSLSIAFYLSVYATFQERTGKFAVCHDRRNSFGVPADGKGRLNVVAGIDEKRRDQDELNSVSERGPSWDLVESPRARAYRDRCPRITGNSPTVTVTVADLQTPLCACAVRVPLLFSMVVSREVPRKYIELRARGYTHSRWSKSQRAQEIEKERKKERETSLLLLNLCCACGRHRREKVFPNRPPWTAAKRNRE